MMRPSSRIVVGYDGTAGAGIAVDWAAAEAARRGATLSLVHAVHRTQLTGAAAHPGAAGSWTVDAAVVVAEAGVDRARQMRATALVTTETTATTAARALVDASQDASLVVLGTRGRGTTAGELFGSVGVAVTSEAACPVVVVRGDPRPPGPARAVVVGVDGSPHSEIALRYAADLAAAHAAPLSVVTAWRRGRAGSRPFTPLAQLEGLEHDRQARQEARRTAVEGARLAAGLYPALAVETQVREGRAPDALAAVAEGAGLVVVGTRGRGGLAGLVLGSVSHTVMHTAPCPAVVVPAG